MHSFLYFRRAGGSHIFTLFYTCNMQKRENKAIFLRISEDMAKKRRNIQPTAKRNWSMQGFAPRKHPRQACNLDCIAKLRFAFQPSLQAIQLRQTFRSSRQAHLLRQPAIIFRIHLFLQSKSQPSLSQQPSFRLVRPTPSRPFSLQSKSQPSGSQYLPSRRQPANTLPLLHLSIPGLTTFQ